jgi:hypothetical protein
MARRKSTGRRKPCGGRRKRTCRKPYCKWLKGKGCRSKKRLPASIRAWPKFVTAKHKAYLAKGGKMNRQSFMTKELSGKYRFDKSKKKYVKKAKK